MWDFETDPAYQAELDWAASFVREEIAPLRYVISNVLDIGDPIRQALIPPLQQSVREHNLWATHLGPELGGQGHGQLELALLNEVLGEEPIAPIVFGCQAPDTGNAEILAHYGTEQHKQTYLQPLLDGQIFSCYSMTEPHGGSDPTAFTTTAVLDGDEWVINGEKWFSSNARYASFLIVMCVTEPDSPAYQRQSMIIVPSDTPGIEIVRNVGIGDERPDEGTHAYIRYHDVRVPKENVLGRRGEGFIVAQTRLGGGRIHHAMRTVGMARQALEMMLERALSRRTQGELLSKKQLVQEMIAESWLDLQQFRLLVLQTAWKIDRYQDYKRVRGDISAVKAAMPGVLNRIASRALQVHGSLGLSNEMPFVDMLLNAYLVGLADGPTEVHKTTLARSLFRDVKPADGLFPSQHIVAQREAALARYADVLAAHGR
ncbi:acyl-CoA dehydrogenase family protein [Nocardia jiangxiensis]|uniref:Acyl-CoA dehydrogenase family protein n=1 Tax=Nocardia jiangxiensis TaxID=282685 RepID=A0ABW6RX63_9NOCA